MRGQFTFRKRNSRGKSPGTHYLGVLRGLREGLDSVEERKFLAPAENRTLYSVAIPLIYFYSCRMIKNVYKRSRYSDWLRAGRPRVWSSSPGRVKYFLFSAASRPALGPTQPPIHWVPGVLYPGVKRQRREADHLSPTRAEVKKKFICTFSFSLELQPQWA
jgi:hypothetical protein